MVRNSIQALAAVLFLATSAYGSDEQKTVESRPNIVFFIADNWASPHASILGDPTVKTPVFDRIAQEGVLFRNAFCPVPSCSPARACLLTGRAAHQLEDAASLWSGFPFRFQVFTTELEKAGYDVGYSGKAWSPGRYLEYGWKENPVGRHYKSFDEFLKQHDASRPFFFWHGNTDTSLNKWNYDADGHQGLDPKTIKVPSMLPDCEAVRESILAYYGSVQRVDAEAGRLLGLLESQELLENTMVVYTSDNGWQMPRGLANCYDAGTHVPLAIRWGRKLQAGRIVEDFVNLTDMAPTFLEVAGLPPVEEMTGRSFLDVLNGQASKSPRDCVFIERERHANVRRGDLSYPIRGIRTKQFLYLWNMRPDRWPAGDPDPWFAVGAFGDVDNSRAKSFMVEHADDPMIRPHFELCFSKRPEVELYDLSRDPDQVTNIAGKPEYAEGQQELKTRLEAWMHETADPRVDPAYDEWDKYPYFGGSFRDQPKKVKQ